MVVLRQRVSPVSKTCIKLSDNPKIVDDSGYVPLSTLISRFERSGELKQMYQRLTNPNSSIDKVIEDFSALEQCGDSLEVMAFAKNAMDKIRSSGINVESAIPSGRLDQVELADKLFKALD